MSPLAIGVIVVAYAIGACLMMALWSHIPPRKTSTDILTGVFWPFTFVFMVPAAFIAATIRAIEDQNGEFAGLVKDDEWHKEQQSRRDA